MKKSIKIEIKCKDDILFPVELIQVLQDTMEAGEETHDRDAWKHKSKKFHIARAEKHFLTEYFGFSDNKSEDHLKHAFTRLGLALSIREGWNK